jgi:hypothetical protein
MVVRFFPFPFPTSSDGAMAFYVPLPFDDIEQAAPGKVLRLEVSFFLPGVLVRFLCKLGWLFGTGFFLGCVDTCCCVSFGIFLTHTLTEWYIASLVWHFGSRRYLPILINC